MQITSFMRAIFPGYLWDGQYAVMVDHETANRCEYTWSEDDKLLILEYVDVIGDPVDDAEFHSFDSNPLPYMWRTSESCVQECWEIVDDGLHSVPNYLPLL
jgi:hypothetical protein